MDLLVDQEGLVGVVEILLLDQMRIPAIKDVQQLELGLLVVVLDRANDLRQEIVELDLAVPNELENGRLALDL